MRYISTQSILIKKFRHQSASKILSYLFAKTGDKDSKEKKNDKEFTALIQEIDIEKFQASVKSGLVDFLDPRVTSRCIYPAIWLDVIRSMISLDFAALRID